MGEEETDPEKLMGWLEREEEEFGITGAVGRTLDWNSCRAMLKEELGYDPSDAQIALMQRAGRYRYEQLPQIGASTEQVIYPQGGQLWYRDVETGRRISTVEAQRRLIEAGLR
ncbi:unnamed protein product [marine sediment metagenome]|uniref:Uncharacterized protein n=1 Tax=marine sediment metagenome TaxID=412755 RepID=X1QV38_9ZZZZ